MTSFLGRVVQTGNRSIRGARAAPAETDQKVDYHVTMATTVGHLDQKGVFLVGADNKVTFHTVKVGIAGDFEVISGLQGGERIVAGTYQAIRALRDAMLVRQAPTDTMKIKGG